MLHPRGKAARIPENRQKIFAECVGDHGMAFGIGVKVTGRYQQSARIIQLMLPRILSKDRGKVQEMESVAVDEAATGGIFVYLAGRCDGSPRIRRGEDDER